MLRIRPLLDRRATAVTCAGSRRWSPEEPVVTAAVVLVRRGLFVRRADGRAAVADTTTGYVQRPGETQQVAHPAGGDVCTTLTLPAGVAERLPPGPVAVPPAADLAHRRLLASAADLDALPLLLGDLLVDVLGALLPVAPAPPDARITDVRAMLHADPAARLDALAGQVGWSPWHLSRRFHLTTGLTITGYRRRLRARLALDALAAGESPAAVAARVGFADQAHLTRTLRRESGLPPAAARRLLSPRMP